MKVGDKVIIKCNVLGAIMQSATICAEFGVDVADGIARELTTCIEAKDDEGLPYCVISMKDVKRKEPKEMDEDTINELKAVGIDMTEWGDCFFFYTDDIEKVE